MRLFLTGHNYKYAVEQILLMMFASERPEYPEKTERDEKSAAFVSLKEGKEFFTAHTKIFWSGKVSHGISRIRKGKLTGELEKDRLLQKIIKLSFYKAAVSIKGESPVWGALTGIRPGKILTNLMEKGVSAKKAGRIMEKEYFVTRERTELCMDTAKTGLSVKNALEKRDIALYIGIPFCPTRCAYCSFVSHSVEKSMKLIEPFVDALILEIDKTAQIMKELELNVISVYIGGGTPTTLSEDSLERLLKKVNNTFNLSRSREYTVEAGRPDTITRGKLKILKKYGVTRISINPQTMSDRVLSAIGRRHTAQDVIDAYNLARAEGFDCINMDLIAGLPEDTAETFYDTLDKVLFLNPENVTVHTLSLKKGTKITLEGTKIPTGEDVSKMLDYSVKRLRESKYMPYYLYRQKFMSGGFENVGWSRGGFDSLYNVCIMEELCTILALGGGGSTKLVAPQTGRIERIFNPKYPYEYIENINSVLEKKDYIKEFYNEHHISD